MSHYGYMSLMYSTVHLSRFIMYVRTDMMIFLASPCSALRVCVNTRRLLGAELASTQSYLLERLPPLKKDYSLIDLKESTCLKGVCVCYSDSGWGLYSV